MNNTIKKNTIFIAAGGTGGHIYPSLSIINEIQNHLFIIITDERGRDYFNNFFINKDINFKIFTHKLSSPNNKFLIKKIKSFYQFFVSTLKSMLLIINYKPDAVIGFGGYPSVTPIVAAKMFNIPSIIHEQNAVIGRANKLLSKFSNILALSFLKTNGTPKLKKSIFTGNPVRKEFLEIGMNKYLLPSKKDFFYILIYGGSLGSSFFSEHLTSVISAIPYEMKKKIKIIQQVRKEDLDLVRKSYKINEIDAEVSYFFEDIAKKFKIAHLIITRSGGSSVAEILASNKPAIFIPLPNSLDNHQYENARFIEINKGGWLINQSNKNINNIEKLINDLLQNPEKLVQASIQLKQLSNKLQELRNNKTPTEFLSECVLKITKYNQKVVHTIC